MTRSCSQCESTQRVVNLYGYFFCARCQTKLGLHTDKTILKNAGKYAQSKPHSYEVEVMQRLQCMEQDFIKKKVKLLHILSRLDELNDRD